MKYLCEQCAVEFQAPPSQKARFCGRVCYDSSREGRFTCDNCSIDFTYYKSHKKGKFVYCSAKCQKEHMVGVRHPNWKGKGYRLIYENFLGRKLTSEDIIHHINGDHNDNRLENLYLTDRAEHCLIHIDNSPFKPGHEPFPRPKYGGK